MGNKSRHLTIITALSCHGNIKLRRHNDKSENAAITIQLVPMMTDIWVNPTCVTTEMAIARYYGNRTPCFSDNI